LNAPLTADQAAVDRMLELADAGDNEEGDSLKLDK